MMYKFVLCLFFVFISFTVFGQSKPDKNRRNNTSYEPGAYEGRGATYDAAAKQSAKTSKGKKNASFRDKKVAEFEQLQKKNKKKYIKMQREMEKPQYSDPSYFGHKKTPKKRPPGKKKLCKECGLWH
ncbi:MAG: hypothetical protein ACFCUU_00995 [Cyclobacteriaceae bacterium]